jgi:hypothetical protein
LPKTGIAGTVPNLRRAFVDGNSESPEKQEEL